MLGICICGYLSEWDRMSRLQDGPCGDSCLATTRLVNNASCDRGCSDVGTADILLQQVRHALGMPLGHGIHFVLCAADK